MPASTIVFLLDFNSLDPPHQRRELQRSPVMTDWLARCRVSTSRPMLSSTRNAHVLSEGLQQD